MTEEDKKEFKKYKKKYVIISTVFMVMTCLVLMILSINRIITFDQLNKLIIIVAILGALSSFKLSMDYYKFRRMKKEEREKSI